MIIFPVSKSSTAIFMSEGPCRINSPAIVFELVFAQGNTSVFLKKEFMEKKDCEIRFGEEQRLDKVMKQ